MQEKNIYGDRGYKRTRPFQILKKKREQRDFDRTMKRPRKWNTDWTKRRV